MLAALLASIDEMENIMKNRNAESTATYVGMIAYPGLQVTLAPPSGPQAPADIGIIADHLIAHGRCSSLILPGRTGALYMRHDRNCSPHKCRC